MSLDGDVFTDNSLSTLTRVYPDFIQQITGKAVCDFGCGEGHQSILISKHAKHVYGLDINLKKIYATQHQIPANVSFGSEPRNGEFDVVISQNSMEHFSKPKEVFEIMKKILKPGGRLFITFGPPWYAPYGAHTRYFTPIPWIHMLLPEHSVMQWRNKYRNDGAKHYEEIEGGLNGMSVGRFETIIKNSGMQCEFRQYDGLKKLNFFTKIPVLREFFTNHVSVILIK